MGRAYKIGGIIIPTGEYRRVKNKLNCKNCGEDFYVTHMNLSKGYCKKCSKRISDKEYKYKNKEKIKTKNKEYRERNKEEIKGRDKEWRDRNIKKVRKRKREYYWKNREEILRKEEGRRRRRGEKENGLSGTEGVALEIIKELFPDNYIVCHDRNTIRNPRTKMFLELDFYIPSLNLAIELNGITHYKPIYGKEKFYRQKRNDFIKKYQCRKKGIYLLIIPLEDGVHFDRYDREHNKLKDLIGEEVSKWENHKDCDFNSHVRN